MKRLIYILFAGLIALTPGCVKQSDGKLTVAFVTNTVDPFWTIAEKGANDAAADPKINVNVKVRMPPNGIEDQQRMVQELLSGKIDGIAISPINAAEQVAMLNEIAAKTNLITQDSDAPKSNRLCFVGIDNYKAGRTCGKMIKEALPNGGSIMIFVGNLSQDNGRLRRQGVIDEVLGRSEDSTRYDNPDAVLEGGNYIILGTKLNGDDRPKAKQLAEDAMTRHKDLGCMVGLFAYNPPMCLDAVRDAGKLGKVKIVAFDEQDATLQGIKDGNIVGTVVQNPYMYGYESVRILAALARGDKSVLPPGGTLLIPDRSITRDNVDEFWSTLKKRLGQGS